MLTVIEKQDCQNACQNWTLLKLNKDLREFGLNPDEWILVPKNECKYGVISVSDSKFRFIGETTSTKEGFPKWVTLTVESL